MFAPEHRALLNLIVMAKHVSNSDVLDAASAVLELHFLSISSSVNSSKYGARCTISRLKFGTRKLAPHKTALPRPAVLIAGGSHHPYGHDLLESCSSGMQWGSLMDQQLKPYSDRLLAIDPRCSLLGFIHVRTKLNSSTCTAFRTRLHVQPFSLLQGGFSRRA